MLSHYGMNVGNGIYTLAYRTLDIAAMPIGSLKDAAMPNFFVRERRGYRKQPHWRSVFEAILSFLLGGGFRAVYPCSWYPMLPAAALPKQ